MTWGQLKRSLEAARQAVARLENEVDFWKQRAIPASYNTVEEAYDALLAATALEAPAAVTVSACPMCGVDEIVVLEGVVSETGWVGICLRCDHHWAAPPPEPSTETIEGVDP